MKNGALFFNNTIAGLIQLLAPKPKPKALQPPPSKRAYTTTSTLIKKQCFLLVITLVIIFSACKKDNNPGGDGSNHNYGPGNIFFKTGTKGIRKMNMQTGEVNLVMADWQDAGWDISWDGTKGVKQIGPTGFETITTYIIFNTSDASTIKEISYQPFDDDGGLPAFSPDGTKLALRPTFDDGLVILDMNGKVIKNISGYGSTHEFKYLDPISWEPGGTILFKKDGGLWRTTNDFSRATKIRDIPFSDWRGYASASPDGKKIALSLGNHIWLMNADGSDFHAVTESNQQEVAPFFSPDGKYIAIKANSRAPQAGDAAASAMHLCIIPADGQVYKVWPGEDNRVIHPQPKGGSDSRGLGMAMVGDFVWHQ